MDVSETNVEVAGVILSQKALFRCAPLRAANRGLKMWIAGASFTAVAASGLASSTYENAIAAQLQVQRVATSSTTIEGLPNHSLTPGATNPQVTQSNIGSTICIVGFSKTVRPPVSYTSPLKRSQLEAGYNLGGDLAMSDYEEDHLIPLEVGGNPTDVKNLWPEPRNIAWGAAKKDKLENKLHLLVCAHQLQLKAAQQVFATNWIAGYKKYVSGQ